MFVGGNQFAPLFVDGAERFQVQGDVAALRHVREDVQMFPKITQVVHDGGLPAPCYKGPTRRIAHSPQAEKSTWAPMAGGFLPQPGAMKGASDCALRAANATQIDSSWSHCQFRRSRRRCVLLILRAARGNHR